MATFIDTNVLVYAASSAAEDKAKRAVARELLQESGIAFSAQVLQEFYAVAVTKQRLAMSHDEALAVIHSLAAYPVCSITRELVIEAIEAKARFVVSYWDAAILVAARQLNCNKIYSEDLNPGQKYDPVEVVNPFASLGPS